MNRLRPVVFVLAGALTLGPLTGLAAAYASGGRARARARLSIEARPPVPVRVFINGRPLGTTPIANASIRPGRCVIEAVRPDGVRIKRVMRLRAGQDAKVVLADADSSLSTGAPPLAPCGIVLPVPAATRSAPYRHGPPANEDRARA
jgi:hypothetical protein